MRQFVICLLIAFMSFGLSATDQLDRADIIFADETKHTFAIELAITPDERAKGMMFRRTMAPDSGMLFIFSRSQKMSFWMRNTYIPLDILFLDKKGRILNIVRNAEPETDTPRRSRGKAIAVLEIPGGRAAELGIKPGHHVRHPLIGNLPDDAPQSAL